MLLLFSVSEPTGGSFMALGLIPVWFSVFSINCRLFPSLESCFDFECDLGFECDRPELLLIDGPDVFEQ